MSLRLAVDSCEMLDPAWRERRGQMTRRTIQAIRVHQYGGPQQLRLEQIPCPVPREGEVLVRMHATGVLPAEWKMRQGLFQRFSPASFPYIPGSALAGVVEEVGAGVTQLQEGQAVFGRTPNGAYAEFATAPVDTLALKPATLSFDEAATISGGATTAWMALFENGALQPGQRVLIHAAAGGVGSYAVQLARWKGAHVIGTASRVNADFVRSLGAETVLDYAAAPFEQVVHEVDLVLDTMGGDTLERSLDVVKRGGTLVSLLEQPSQERARERGIRAVRITTALPFPSTHLLEAIAQLLEAGQVKAIVGTIFPLHEARQAHELSQAGHGRGRIVLHIAD
jgi:NADPH:quinone reductase-like Zn-dependent oxidoreductase